MTVIANSPALVIAGAGPAGSTASAFLCQAQIPHIILDKAIFPRDKICGDALSGKVFSILKKLDPDAAGIFKNDHDHFTGSYGIRFASPNGKSIDIPFRKDYSSLENPPGFIARRMDFDYFLTRYIKSDYADFRQGHELKNINRDGNKLILEIKNGNNLYQLSTSLLIAAEGDRSITARTLSGHKKNPNHYCGGIRSYYKGVEGIHEMKYIELHFLKELLPGYFWIFPLPGGYANVGIGLLTSEISRKRINLKESMLKAISTHPEFQKRFRHAEMEGPIQGWGLPLGSLKRKLTGDNYILTGDAASMIDPFTGEGISNAMFCGMAAAETAISAFESGSYNDKFLSGYNERVYKRMWYELRLSHTLQKLCNYPWLFNFVIGKAEKNNTFRETLSCMFEDLDMRAKFRQPSFYFKLLFGGK